MWEEHVRLFISLLGFDSCLEFTIFSVSVIHKPLLSSFTSTSFRLKECVNFVLCNKFCCKTVDIKISELSGFANLL